VRQRLILFHEDPSVVSAFRLAASGWRVARARSLRELKTLAARRPPEIIVTDGQSHGVVFSELLPAVMGAWPTIRLFLCISELSDDPAGLISSLLAREHGLYVAVANTEDIAVLSDAASAQLRELLYEVRLLPYAPRLAQDCVRVLSLSGTLLEPLPGFLMHRPLSCRRPGVAAAALGTVPDAVLEASRELGYERTERLLFRVRAQLAAGLFATGNYSWPEARETFGEGDGSNFRRRLRQWFELQPGDLVPGYGSRWLSQDVGEPTRSKEDQLAGKSYRPHLKTYRVLAANSA
jgi:hypothetical protein